MSFKKQGFESEAHQKGAESIPYNQLLEHHCLSKLLAYTLKRAWFEAPANWDLVVLGFCGKIGLQILK